VGPSELSESPRLAARRGRVRTYQPAARLVEFRLDQARCDQLVFLNPFEVEERTTMSQDMRERTNFEGFDPGSE
jgi:hypothetical protein